MRIVVTGGPDGQVLLSLAERGTAAGHEIVPVGRPELDLAGDEDAISRVIEQAKPDIVVSAAAYTAVDKAEREHDLAFAINGRGAGAVAKAAGAPRRSGHSFCRRTMCSMDRSRRRTRKTTSLIR